MKHQHGFTAVELMVTLSIMVILSALALPSFQTFMAENRARGKAIELAAALQTAQSEALRRNRQVVFSFTDSPNPVDALTASATGKGWASSALPLPNASVTAIEVINVGGYTEGTGDVQITSPTAALCFIPNGALKANTSTGITGATCTVDATNGVSIILKPARGDKAWQVQVTPLGKILSCTGSVNNSNVFTCA